MVQSYDNWRTNGSWNTCECGAQYNDYEGPCHLTCKRCDSLIDVDELNDDRLCETCENNPPCEGCGENFPVASLVEGLCKGCREEDEPK